MAVADDENPLRNPSCNVMICRSELGVQNVAHNLIFNLFDAYIKLEFGTKPLCPLALMSQAIKILGSSSSGMKSETPKTNSRPESSITCWMILDPCPRDLNTAPRPRKLDHVCFSTVCPILSLLHLPFRTSALPSEHGGARIIQRGPLLGTTPSCLWLGCHGLEISHADGGFGSGLSHSAL